MDLGGGAAFLQTHPGHPDVHQQFQIVALPEIGVFLEHARDHARGGQGHAMVARQHARGRGRHMGLHDLQHALTVENWGIRQEVIDRRAQAVNVAADILPPPEHFFRGDIKRRAQQVLLAIHLRRVQHGFCQTKIHDFHRLCIPEHEVGRLHIPVQKPALVSSLQPQGRLFGKPENLGLAQTERPLQKLGHGAQTNQFHRHIVEPVVHPG